VTSTTRVELHIILLDTSQRTDVVSLSRAKAQTTAVVGYAVKTVLITAAAAISILEKMMTFLDVAGADPWNTHMTTTGTDTGSPTGVRGPSNNIPTVPPRGLGETANFTIFPTGSQGAAEFVTIRIPVGPSHTKRQTSMTVASFDPIQYSQNTAGTVVLVFGIVGERGNGLGVDRLFLRTGLVFLTVETRTQTSFLQRPVPALAEHGPRM
jgi:hypothetical protein